MADDHTPHRDAPASVQQALALGGDPEQVAAYYDEWAERYDAEVSVDYGAPMAIVETLAAAVGEMDDPAPFSVGEATVLDAGCGTGLSGEALHAVGYTDLHGVDLSEEMVARARRRGIYRSLEGGVDLTRSPSDDHADRYDIVTVAGVFTPGHVPPTAVATVASCARPGGVVVASIRRRYLDESDFVEVEQRLCDEGVVERLLHRQALPYTMDSTADYYAWRRPAA